MANPRDVDLDIVAHDRTALGVASANRRLGTLDDHLTRIGRTGKDVDRELRGLGPSLAASINSVGIVAITALAAVFGPAISGMIGGAILAGGVGGMIALAAYLNKDNPAVVKAADRLGTTFRETFAAAAAPLSDEIANSLTRWNTAVAGSGPMLSRAFAAIAPYVGRLSDALAGMVTAFLPGFVSGLEDAQPVIDALADQLPVIGYALGRVFALLGEHADAIAVAVNDLGTFTVGAITAIGYLIVAGAELNKAMHAATEGVIDAYVSMVNGIRTAIGDILSQVSRWVGAMGSRWASLIRMAAGAADAIGMDAAAERLRGAAARIDAQTKAIQRSIDALRGKVIPITVSVDLTAYNRARALAARGVRIPLAGGLSFAETAPGQNARTGGPEPTQVDVATRVYLDGQPFYAMVSTEVSGSASRSAWRTRTGRR